MTSWLRRTDIGFRYAIQYSDGSGWSNAFSEKTVSASQSAYVDLITLEAPHPWWRINFVPTAEKRNNDTTELQFYGRVSGGIQTLLRIANITNKHYTTISGLLSDSTTTTAVLNNTDCIDYLVNTDLWIDDIVNNEDAMTAIGNNNYAANTLLANSDWCTAICNSAYFESVLNTKNPVMTSNTTPSGVASANGNYTDYYPWKAFDGNDSTSWASPSTASLSDWLKYEFADDGIIIKKIRIKSNRYQTYKIQASNDNSSWTDLYSGVTGDVSTYIENTIRYKYIKYVPTSLVGGSASGSIDEFKVYGREDV